MNMAKFGAQCDSQTLLIAGVYFMGETAKILSPEKTVKVLAPETACSLDLGCPAEAFGAFCDQHPDHTVVVYANTSAAVKARRLGRDIIDCSRRCLTFIKMAKKFFGHRINT